MIGLPALAADLVSRKVDVIVEAAAVPSAASAAKAATSTIPIVFISGGDPVAAGLVASLARPGGNLTGISFIAVELSAKAARAGVGAGSPGQGDCPAGEPERSGCRAPRSKDMQEAARAKGLQLQILKAGTESEIEAAFASLAQRRCRRARRRRRPILRQPARTAHGAGITPCDTGDLCLARHIAEAGGLISYGAEHNRCLSPGWRLTSAGSSRAPSRPICRCSNRPNSSWSINLKTAKALGLTVPQTMLDARRRGHRVTP